MSAIIPPISIAELCSLTAQYLKGAEQKILKENENEFKQKIQFEDFSTWIKKLLDDIDSKQSGVVVLDAQLSPTLMLIGRWGNFKEARDQRLRCLVIAYQKLQASSALASMNFLKKNILLTLTHYFNKYGEEPKCQDVVPQELKEILKKISSERTKDLKTSEEAQYKTKKEKEASLEAKLQEEDEALCIWDLKSPQLSSTEAKAKILSLMKNNQTRWGLPIACSNPKWVEEVCRGKETILYNLMQRLEKLDFLPDMDEKSASEIGNITELFFQMLLKVQEKIKFSENEEVGELLACKNVKIGYVDAMGLSWLAYTNLYIDFLSRNPNSLGGDPTILMWGRKGNSQKILHQTVLLNFEGADNHRAREKWIIFDPFLGVIAMYADIQKTIGAYLKEEARNLDVGFIAPHVTENGWVKSFNKEKIKQARSKTWKLVFEKFLDESKIFLRQIHSQSRNSQNSGIQKQVASTLKTTQQNKESRLVHVDTYKGISALSRCYYGALRLKDRGKSKRVKDLLDMLVPESASHLGIYLNDEETVFSINCCAAILLMTRNEYRELFPSALLSGLIWKGAAFTADALKYGGKVDDTFVMPLEQKPFFQYLYGKILYKLGELSGSFTFNFDSKQQQKLLDYAKKVYMEKSGVQLTMTTTAVTTTSTTSQTEATTNTSQESSSAATPVIPSYRFEPNKKLRAVTTSQGDKDIKPKQKPRERKS